MQFGMIGLGRMGANMVRRFVKGGHQCVAYDSYESARDAMKESGFAVVNTMAEMVAKLDNPRVLWIMVPASAVDAVVDELAPLLSSEDIIVDGGNSYFRDDIRRATKLWLRQLYYLDVGTSGGVAGFERGYCLMIGGENEAFRRVVPLFATLAPGLGAAAPTPGRASSALADSDADKGYLHCGPHGAGHFVKMVHNGIEYGIMAAYAEGFNILRHADAGMRQRNADAETAPWAKPEIYQYEMDVANIAEVWRRGSVIDSWLLDLTAVALVRDPELIEFNGLVSDSGEGCWTVAAAIDLGVPAPVLGAALFARFESRGNANYADKLLSAMRHGFGGDREQDTPDAGGIVP